MRSNSPCARRPGRPVELRFPGQVGRPFVFALPFEVPRFLEAAREDLAKSPHRSSHPRLGSRVQSFDLSPHPPPTVGSTLQLASARVWPSRGDEPTFQP